MPGARRPATKSRPLPALSAEQLADLQHRYWATDEPRAQIERSLKLTSAQLSELLPALPADGECPRCGSALEWRSRQGRQQGDARCPACRHRTGGRCSCPPCRSEDEDLRREEARRETEERVAKVESWLTRYGDEDCATDAVKSLTRTQRIYLDALIEYWASDASFEEIARLSGVQRHWVEPYVQRLIRLRLIFHDGNQYHLHPTLQPPGP